MDRYGATREVAELTSLVPDIGEARARQLGYTGIIKMYTAEHGTLLLDFKGPDGVATSAEVGEVRGGTNTNQINVSNNNSVQVGITRVTNGN